MSMQAIMKKKKISSYIEKNTYRTAHVHNRNPETTYPLDICEAIPEQWSNS